MYRTASFDPDRRSRYLRAAALLTLSASLLLLVLAGGHFVLQTRGALAASQSSFFDLFPVNHPQFHDSFWRSLRSAFQPSDVLHHLTTFPSAIVTVAAALAGYFLYRARRARTSLGLSVLLALSPAVVGLALFPLTLRGMVESFAVLAEQGLTNPAAQASGIGQATAMVAFGALLSLLCLLFVVWARHREPLLEEPAAA